MPNTLGRLWLICACVGLCAAIEPNWDNARPIEGPFNFTLDYHSHGDRLNDEEVVSSATLVEPLAINLKGWVTRLEDELEVQYDIYRFDPATIAITLTNAAQVPLARCTGGKIGFESVVWDLRGCVGDRLDSGGNFGWTVEGRTRAGVLESLWASLVVFRFNKHPWPFTNDDQVWPPRQPNLAGNLVENYQSFSGQASAYWHEGVDIIVARVSTYAQPCHTPIAGRVVNIVRYSGSDLYWSVMVEDSWGFIWQFHHLDPRTFRVQIGSTVRVGDVLGEVAIWPASWNGNPYHHVHLNIVRPHPSWIRVPNPYVDGWQYFNVLDFLDMGDYRGGTEAPTSPGVMWFLPNENNVAFAASNDATQPIVSGAVDIIMQWRSDFAPTNSIRGHPYPNCLYEVGYEITPVVKNASQAGETFSRRLMRTHKLPNEWAFNLPDLRTRDADLMLRRVFRQSFSYRGTTMQSAFTYTTRVMYYTLTNSFRGQPDAVNGFWDTNGLLPGSTERRFPNGDYIVTGYGCDVFDKCRSYSHRVTVRN